MRLDRPTVTACLLAAAMGLAGTANAAEPPVVIAPHRAVYDLSLDEVANGILGADGRMAISLERPDCQVYDVDYRFVARFQKEDELIVTDQRTTSTESVSGDHFEFDTKTFVDSSPLEEVSGDAVQTDTGTRIAFDKPEKRSVTIPTALFPTQQMMSLIENARAGRRIVENRIYDGDRDAEKNLTSTSIIAARDSASAPSQDAAPDADDISPRDALKGLKSWRISESFYNEDSDVDGTPIFETAYTLYENGVSDDLKLGFEGYTLVGGLSSLDLLASPVCP